MNIRFICLGIGTIIILFLAINVFDSPKILSATKPTFSLKVNGIFPYNLNEITHVDYCPPLNLAVVENWNGHVNIWNVKNGDIITVFDHKEKGSFRDSSFLNDKLVVTLMREKLGEPLKTVKLIDINTGKEVKSIFSSNEIFTIACLPRTNQVAIGLNKEVKIFDLNTSYQTCTFSRKYHLSKLGIRKIFFSPNGKHLGIIWDDRELQIWDIQEKKEILNLKNAYYIAFNAVTAQVAVVVNNKYNVQIFNLENLKTQHPEKVIPLDKCYVSQIIYSPDGKFLASSAMLKHKSFVRDELIYPVCEWNLSTGEMTVPYEGKEAVKFISYSSDGKELIGTTGDGEVIRWPTSHK